MYNGLDNKDFKSWGNKCWRVEVIWLDEVKTSWRKCEEVSELIKIVKCTTIEIQWRI